MPVSPLSTLILRQAQDEASFLCVMTTSLMLSLSKHEAYAAAQKRLHRRRFARYPGNFQSDLLQPAVAHHSPCIKYEDDLKKDADHAARE